MLVTRSKSMGFVFSTVLWIPIWQGEEVNDKEDVVRRAKGRGRGGRGRGRGHHHNNHHHNNNKTGGHAIGTPPSSHPIQPEQPAIAKQPPGPRMPDGTRGFTIGRGKPVAPPTCGWWLTNPKIYTASTLCKVKFIFLWALLFKIDCRWNLGVLVLSGSLHDLQCLKKFWCKELWWATFVCM